MLPQAIIHTYAQYTYAHAQYSFVVWGSLRLTPIKTSTGNSQWQTVRQSSRHAEVPWSCYVTTVTMACPPDYTQNWLNWYEIRVLDAFPLVNCTKICGSHLPVEVRPRCNNHWFWQITDMYVLSIEPHSWSIKYVVLCVYGGFVWLPDNLQICNKF